MCIAWPVQFHTQQAGYIHFWVTLLQGTCSTSSNDAIITPCIVRVLGVTLDRRLTFDYHASAVARSCNYHARAIRHIRHLLTLDLAHTLLFSLILSRINYCNLLYGALYGAIQKSSEPKTTRRVSFFKRLDGHTSIRCFRRCTGCLLNSASTTSWRC